MLTPKRGAALIDVVELAGVQGRRKVVNPRSTVVFLLL